MSSACEHTLRPVRISDWIQSYEHGFEERRGGVGPRKGKREELLLLLETLKVWLANHSEATVAQIRAKDRDIDRRMSNIITGPVYDDEGNRMLILGERAGLFNRPEEIVVREEIFRILDEAIENASDNPDRTRANSLVGDEEDEEGRGGNVRRPVSDVGFVRANMSDEDLEMRATDDAHLTRLIARRNLLRDGLRFSTTPPGSAMGDPRPDDERRRRRRYRRYGGTMLPMGIVVRNGRTTLMNIRRWFNSQSNTLKNKIEKGFKKIYGSAGSRSVVEHIIEKRMLNPSPDAVDEVIESLEEVMRPLDFLREGDEEYMGETIIDGK
jgi:hypothetical protein|nr:MAG: hypothetical protein [Lake Baikal virophage 3]